MNTMHQTNNQIDISVTGMGVLSTHGLGLTELEKALKEGINPFTISTRFAELSFPVIAAELPDISFEIAIRQFNQLPSALIERAFQAGRRAPLTIQASILAAMEAWEYAQLSSRDIDPERIGIIVAGQNTTQAYQYHLHRKFQDAPDYLSPTYALHFMDTDQVGTLSEVFNIQGEGFTVGGASASGNVGIIQACRLIKQNNVDICLVIGTLADLSPIEIQGFRNIGALGGINFHDQPLKAARPFDAEHEGFIWGQASGCLILESAAFTKKYNTPTIGKISGTSMSLDANRFANPTIAGEVKVMRQALTQAYLLPADIQYINTHGSSSPLGDKTEISAIKEVLGDATNQVWLNSTKSITGHCLWSAGIIETIATLLQMQKKFIHPNLNLQNPIDQQCRFAGDHLENVAITAALSNSFGFGGINTSIVITKES
jgi:malonyl-ACP decarboxylase